MIFSKKEKSSPLPPTERPMWMKVTAGAVAALVVFLLATGWYWSRTPDIFWVTKKTNGDQTVVGYATTDTLIRVAETLIDKPGGLISNDVSPPGIFMDNMPNWEKGVLQQVRDLARVMRNDYSRSQSQSREDPDLATAEPAFFNDRNSWILPRPEAKYRDAIEGFRNYRDRLAGGNDQEAQFFARADNLRTYLEEVEKRLGSLTRRLGDSVTSTVINTDLAGDAAAEANTTLSDNVEVRTSWFETDDIFFESRGTSWAMLHFLRAVEIDFAQVLDDKNARASVRQIIRELEASLQPLRSPMVLNGGGFGLFANHSLVMANYLARANAAVINLRELLDKG